MTSKMVGSLVFLIMSVLLWWLTSYFSSRAEDSKNFHTYTLVVGFTAFILSLHTVLYILFAGRKKCNRDYYLQYGKPVEAEIIKIGRRGKRTAWRIKARYRDLHSGKEIIFKSDILRHNPSAKFRVGNKIVVYLHPKNPSQYWMDINLGSEYL